MKALITGITGQDGSYLAEFLLDKGYEVHGLIRRSSGNNTGRIDHIIEAEAKGGGRLHLHYGDMTDSANLTGIIKAVQPNEIYNLAAQSHVKVSFESPEYTANSDALGTLRILEVIRVLGLENWIRFYQASTSEMFGKVDQVPQDENTRFYPRSPYAAAKVYGYWITRNYREAYNIFACNGILFNHESPRRGETFVTRKITRAVARISLGLQETLYLGNLDAKRDWGFAGDYVAAMWMMLQRDRPEDYVIATGETHSVREFAEKAFAYAGVRIRWEGDGVNEQGVVADLTSNTKDSQVKIGQAVVQIDPNYFRPTEVDLLAGDASKARAAFGWKQTVSFDRLIAMMMTADLEAAKKDNNGANKKPNFSADLHRRERAPLS